MSAEILDWAADQLLRAAFFKNRCGLDLRAFELCKERFT